MISGNKIRHNKFSTILSYAEDGLYCQLMDATVVGQVTNNAVFEQFSITETEGPEMNELSCSDRNAL